MSSNPSYCREEKRKARKQYYCECCGAVISKGMIYTALVGVWEGQMMTLKIHASCYESYQKFCSAGDYLEDEYPAFIEFLDLLHQEGMADFYQPEHPGA